MIKNREISLNIMIEYRIIIVLFFYTKILKKEKS